MKHKYKVKLLTGPLAGRQVMLPAGDFTIGGNDPDLDIALEGGHRAVLTVDEGGVALATAARCWIDGAPVKTLPDVLPSDVVLDIGGLGLVLGEADDTIAQTTVPARRDKRPRGVLRKRVAWAGLMLMASLGTGGAIWVYAQIQSGYVAADPDAWRHQWDIDARKRGLRLAANADGLRELTGNCQDSGERNRLLRQLRDHGVMFRDITQCQDELVRNVQAVLGLHGFEDARVRPGAQLGTVTITGRILADSRWQKAVAAMATMRGLEQWSVEDAAGVHVRSLIDMLRHASLIGKLSVARENGLILLTGVLDEGAQRNLGSVLAAFGQRFPDAPKTIFQNIPTSRLQAGIFPSPIVSFGGSNDLAFLDLANGTRVKKGSRLPSGYAIVGIDRNGIDLERDGELMHLPLEL